jgi:hypothetical protein
VPLDFGYTVETKDTPAAFAVRKDNGPADQAQ